jgi:hypothetical protein
VKVVSAGVLEAEPFGSAGAGVMVVSAGVLEAEPFASAGASVYSAALFVLVGLAVHFQPPQSPATATSIAITISSFSATLITGFPPGVFRLGVGIRGQG